MSAPKFALIASCILIFACGGPEATPASDATVDATNPATTPASTPAAKEASTTAPAAKDESKEASAPATVASNSEPAGNSASSTDAAPATTTTTDSIPLQLAKSECACLYAHPKSIMGMGDHAPLQECGNKAYAKLGLTFPTKEQVMESRQRQTSVKIFESDADNQTHQRHVMGCLAKIQQAVPAYASRTFSKDCAADCAAENELKPLCLAMCGNPDAMKARPSGGRPQ